MSRKQRPLVSLHRVVTFSQTYTDSSSLCLSAEATSAETSNRLVDLTERLREAQQERARRIEYDTIAKTISKLPTREKGKE